MTAALIAIGILVGLGSGLLSERLPISPMAQSVTAAGAAAILSTIAVSMAWIRETASELHSAAMTFDLARGLLTLVLVVGLAASLHAGLGWLGGMAHPVFGRHRPITIGLVVGCLSALAVLVAVRSPE